MNSAVIFIPSNRYCGWGVPVDGQIVFVLQASVNLRRRCLLFLMRMICANLGSSFCGGVEGRARRVSRARLGGGDGPMRLGGKTVCRGSVVAERRGERRGAAHYGATRAANIALGSRGSRIDPRGAVKPPPAPSLAVIALAIQGAKKPMGTSQGERGGGQKIQPGWVSSRAPCRSSASTRRTLRIAAR